MYALLFKNSNCIIIKDIDVVTVEHNDIIISSMVNGSIHTEFITFKILN